ncbi:MAG: hypothetical protein R6X18_09305 [Chloroflexota bacterium]|jgi:hypothetical protein
MTNPNNLSGTIPFDDETWQALPNYLGNLPEPVCLHVWGDENAGQAERETANLVQILNNRFPNITYRLLPRRINYPYYPVIGVFGGTVEESIDYGVRIIGLPAGYQMTTLVAGIQAVAFRGQTLEPMTRIHLHKLANSEKSFDVELLTSRDDMEGSVAAKIIFGAAVANRNIMAYVIITDNFPEAALRYSAEFLPHVIINQRIHFDGVLDEEKLLELLSRASQSTT